MVQVGRYQWRGRQSRLLINDYVSVARAAIEGQGVALGWRHLTDRLIASGLLVRASEHLMTIGKRFHVAWPKNRALSEGARQVRDWIAAQRCTQRGDGYSR
jgi:DNA-binding transcriptional LysR family regulator